MNQDTRTSVNVSEQLEQRRLSMVALPTPLEEAGRLPSGRRPLMKCDDPTSLEMWGNTTQKAEMISGGYDADDAVRAALGYPGQVARPVSEFDYPEYVEEGRIDTVLERGQVWRMSPAPMAWEV